MKCALGCVLAMSVCLPAMAQQTDISRYTVYTGFAYPISPAPNLTQRRFEVDFGVTAKPWLGLGGDFSVSGNAIISGGGTFNGSETVYAPTLIASNAQNPLVPLPNMIAVPFKSATYTFAAGPQFYIRKWKKVTFLVRPGLGRIHESADLTFPPGLGGLFQLLNIPPPKPHQTDLTWFIGVGGGFDLNLSQHVGLRFTADWINTHLFSDLLSNTENYARFTVGPTLRWAICSSGAATRLSPAVPGDTFQA